MLHPHRVTKGNLVYGISAWTFAARMYIPHLFMRAPKEKIEIRVIAMTFWKTLMSKEGSYFNPPHKSMSDVPNNP